MTKTLNPRIGDVHTAWDDFFNCYITWSGEISTESPWLGEGKTPAASKSDFYDQAYEDERVAILVPGDEEGFTLTDGVTSIDFDDLESAIAYADKRHWML